MSAVRRAQIGNVQSVSTTPHSRSPASLAVLLAHEMHQL